VGQHDPHDGASLRHAAHAAPTSGARPAGRG
jgi:hypothetical protein